MCFEMEILRLFVLATVAQATCNPGVPNFIPGQDFETWKVAVVFSERKAQTLHSSLQRVFQRDCELHAPQCFSTGTLN